ncbi:MAG: NAD(P)/FAD-dependent oxidoreductase [Clostridia bacterium]|nr:NAD(P)/FAD-dependent oxidoreductase [Clostridia bacterium]
MYDVAIIGGGIVGCAAAERLSQYKVNIAVIDRASDVADGTTKANSGIVHAGYDAPAGSLMARLNLEGSRLMEEECSRLDVPLKKTGSFVLAFTPEDEDHLKLLLKRGKENGVLGLEILSGDEVRRREPALSGEVRAALWAPSAAVVDPFQLCAAYAEVAAENGTDFLLEQEVQRLTWTDDHWVIDTDRGPVEAAYVVNAAGVHADEIQAMAGKREFAIQPVRGEYYLMDKTLGDLVSSVIFQCPGPLGKGVLVAPTVHGNLLIGPNAEPVADRDDTETTLDGQDYVRRTAARSVPDINYREAIRNFAGVRANSGSGDFIIGMSESAPQFLNLAGIGSPGLSSSPAIARMAVEILRKDGLTLVPRDKAATSRCVVRVRDLPPERRQEVIAENPLYGRVICRCETVTEGEIVDAMHSKLVPHTVDGVKKRCGTGMGRCQGGFCQPRILNLLSRELDLKPEEVRQDNAGSEILKGELP